MSSTEEQLCCSFDIQNNSLNFIKLIAALQVFLGHAVTHFELWDTIPEIAREGVYFIEGVPIFFGISGFLIWLSVSRSKTAGSFYLKRYKRIYPKLWFAVALEIIIMWFLYGTGGSIKSLVAFIFTQSTVFQFWTPDSLRGYGCGTPNGSLWTICVIIQFYLIVWFIYKLFLKKKFSSWIILFCSSIALSMLLQKIFESYMPEIIVKLYGQTIIRYGWIFIAGCFIAEFKDMFLPYITKYWWIALVVYVVRRGVGLDIHAGYNLTHSISQIVMCIGFAYRFPNINIKTDISYEVYLFHMIVINAMLQLGCMGSWIYMMIALAFTIGISWITNRSFAKHNL